MRHRGKLRAVTVVRHFASVLLTGLMVLGGGCTEGEPQDTAPTATTSSSTTMTTTSASVARTSTTAAPTTTTVRTTTTAGRAPGGGGAVAICRDGTLSYAADHQRGCASHGGVADLIVR